MVVIVALNIVSTIAFLIAFAFGVRNYQKTKHIAGYWLVFSFAALFAALVVGMTALEWAGVYAMSMDEIGESMGVTATTIFAITATLTLMSQIRPTIE